MCLDVSGVIGNDARPHALLTRYFVLRFDTVGSRVTRVPSSWLFVYEKVGCLVQRLLFQTWCTFFA